MKRKVLLYINGTAVPDDTDYALFIALVNRQR